MHQQFGGAERVGHADGGTEHGGDGGELLDDLVVHQRREAEAAVFLRDVEAEELVGLAELPQFRREVRAHVGDVPVVRHPAQGVARAVEEGLLFGGELRLGQGQQLVPVGLAGKQLTLEPDRAGLERGAFGVGQRGQDLRIEVEQRRGDARLAELRDQQGQGDGGDDQAGDEGRGPVRPEQPAGDERAGGEGCPPGQAHPVIGGDRTDDEQYKEGNDDAHPRPLGTCWISGGAVARAGCMRAPYAEVWVARSKPVKRSLVHPPRSVGGPKLTGRILWRLEPYGKLSP
jgi:hypothetical protein